MSTLNYTLIDADPNVSRDDSSVEANPGTSPGNAIKLFQFDAAADQEYELVRTTSGTEPRGSNEGLIMIGSPGNIPWVSLNASGDTPTGSGSEQRLNIDGAIRSRGYLDELGRDIVELLENLLPSAPDLQTYDSPDTGNISSGSGKIGINAPTYLSQNALVAVDGDKTIDPSQRGVIDNSGTAQAFKGDLNFDVGGTNVYSADAFGPGDRGHLELVINGNRPSGTEDGDNTNDDPRYFDLTDLSGNDTAGTSTSGFDIGAAQNVTFANGETYNDGYERTGQYRIDLVDNAFTNDDVNQVEVRHYIDGSVYATTNRIRFYVDAETSAITFSTTDAGNAIGTLTLNNIGESQGAKSLSGIRYADGANAPLKYVVGNAYQTSYSASNTGISPSAGNAAVNSAQIPDNDSVTDEILIADQTAGTGQQKPADDGVYKIRAGNDSEGFGDGPDKVIDSPFQIQLSIDDPIEGVQTSSTDSRYNFLLDDVKTQSNWRTREDFIIEGANQHEGGGEGTRIQVANVNFGSDVSDGNLGAGARYDPTVDISDDSANANYTDELQVYDRQLVYPSQDFSTGFNPNTTTGDYSAASGQRAYVGFAEDKSSNTKDFAIAVNASQATLVEAGTVSSGTDEVSLELRIGGSNDTGWLDVTIAEDQPGGCFASVNGGSQSFNGNDIGIIMDAFSGSSGAGGRLFYKFTYPDGGTAVLDDVTVTYSP